MQGMKRKSMMTVGLSVIIGGAAISLAGAAGGESSSRLQPERESGFGKPNIVFIMSDELGYYEPSYMGNKMIKTPNIDRIAKDGIVFTQGLAGSTVCAPTRCCLMTGKHSGHTSVRSNGGGTPMRAGEVTIASMLKPLGYATGGFGKWGCGGRGSTGVPEKHGFDVFFGYYDQVHAHSYYPPYLIRNSKEVPLPGNKGGTKGETYSHYEIMKEGLKFICENKDKPFFAYFPVTPPHGLFTIPEGDPAWALYKDKPWPEPAKCYAAMTTMMDRGVGEILDLLKDLGLKKKTLVFFCGDNGGHNYFSSKDHPRGFFGANKNPETGVEFRGGKGNLYEGGLRIPMLAYWPGKIAPGQKSDLLWYFPDVMPTIAELTGAKAPADIDGISIVPTLLGEKAAGHKQKQHKYLYWEIGQQIAVREGNWKAVRPAKNKPWELYDLKNDISEKHDLAAEKPEILARLKRYAEEAHEPVEVGTYFDHSLEEKDRRAKFGGKAPKRKAKAGKRTKTADHSLPKGLLSQKGWKIVRVSSENTGNDKYAVNAIDGDPGTIWHSRFSDKLDKHPHEMVIDLGGEHEIHSFFYLPRQDSSWHGVIKDIEFCVGDSPDKFGAPVAKATLGKTREASEIPCSKPVKGRYVLMRSLSEVNGGPWSTAAEIGVKGK